MLFGNETCIGSTIKFLTKGGQRSLEIIVLNEKVYTLQFLTYNVMAVLSQYCTQNFGVLN